MAISPTAEGFRAAFRRPSLTLAEIVWRWSAGTTATALFLFGLFEYLSTLPVTNGELLFLRTRHPYFVAEALARIVRGSLNRVVAAGMLGALMLGALWIVAASVGRIATVRGLLDYFRRDVASSVSAGSVSNDGERDVAINVSSSGPAEPFAALMRLNFLRVAVALAAVFGFVGATILAGFASPPANPQPGVAFFLFLPMAALVCWVWWSLNWLLSLAGMFAVRDGEDAVGSLVAAVALCRERTGPVFAVSTWTGLAHLTVFVGATTVVSMPLGFAGFLPWRLVFIVVMLLTLAYLALADWLYMARLAGYVCIAETPEALLKPLPPAPLPTHPIAGPPLQTTIDRDERILSDLPNLAVET
ncbi:MAG: hypothetical protein ACXWC0_27330 [Burkholderiales bacterium]